MKKMTMLGAGLMLGTLGGAAYLLLNKKTKKRANDLINAAIDDASSYFKKHDNMDN